MNYTLRFLIATFIYIVVTAICGYLDVTGKMKAPSKFYFIGWLGGVITTIILLIPQI